jgi:hypothetical protein
MKATKDPRPGGWAWQGFPIGENMKNIKRSMANRLPCAAALFLVAACAPRLAAQDSVWARNNWGFAGGAQFQIIGDLADAAEVGGPRLAVSLERLWSFGLGVRGTAELAAFNPKIPKGFTDEDKVSSIWQFGGLADLAWYFNWTKLYPFAGAGYVTRVVPDKYEALFDKEKLDNKIAYHAGLGYLFKPYYGIEVRYVQSGYSWVSVSLFIKNNATE